VASTIDSHHGLRRQAQVRPLPPAPPPSLAGRPTGHRHLNRSEKPIKNKGTDPLKIKGQTFYQAAEQTYSKFVTLTAVPEPTVVTFGGIGALLLLRRRRA
jgi:hypothetical protein